MKDVDMLKVGITGGIGSGKTTVCRIFATLGWPVFEADMEARKLMDTHYAIQKKLKAWFGTDIYLPSRDLNRKKLAEIIFNDENWLKKVNELVHPLVRQRFTDWCASQHATHIIHEAAILFESGFYTMMDKTVLVVASEEDRIKRIARRDGIITEDIKQRMANQWKDEQKIPLADYILYNNDTDLIIPQVISLDKKLRANG